jgi:tRNA (mo5U34)-methyltransferase
MEAITGLRFTYLQRNIYELDADELGIFDIVLFLGVLYHLPDMLRALDIVRQLCGRRMYLETAFEADLQPGMAVARYYEASSLGGDYTNFWSPNRECVLSMLRDVGFAPRRDQPWIPFRLLVEADIVGSGRPDKMRAAYGLM